MTAHSYVNNYDTKTEMTSQHYVILYNKTCSVICCDLTYFMSFTSLESKLSSPDTISQPQILLNFYFDQQKISPAAKHLQFLLIEATNPVVNLSEQSAPYLKSKLKQIFDVLVQYIFLFNQYFNCFINTCPPLIKLRDVHR